MEQGYSVSGTARTREKSDLLKKQGINAFIFGNVPSGIIENSTHILSSVPPHEVLGDIVIPFLPTANHYPLTARKWLGYFSTTGVYGDWDGEWVDEKSEPRPNNARLMRRLQAEEQWLTRGGHVFRLAGIYGPGRSVIDDVVEGTARRIDKDGQVFSRIHVDDIAQIVLASMNNPKPKSIYNACDDKPAPAHEVVKFACELLGREAPPLIPFEQAELSPMGREFYSANRRVKNDKIKRDLGVELLYPNYREGLRALLPI